MYHDHIPKIKSSDRPWISYCSLCDFDFCLLCQKENGDTRFVYFERSVINLCIDCNWDIQDSIEGARYNRIMEFFTHYGRLDHILKNPKGVPFEDEHNK